MTTEATKSRGGPLQGLRGVMLGGIGPAPYAAMLLADLGAEITRLERPSSGEQGNSLLAASEIFSRGQTVCRLDLTAPADRDTAWRLIGGADFLIEGFRPGVLERMGFGPAECHQRNARLVIARITGWGQSGPLASAPGHDINYLALTGALSAMATRAGSDGRTIPLNLLGDFAGGGLWACFGILAALQERIRSGRGQVVDAAMVDGVLSLMSMAFVANQLGSLSAPPGSSMLDGGAHFYDTYRCADGKELAVGAVEPQFYERLCSLTGLEDTQSGHHFDSTGWPALKAELSEQVARRSRDDWCTPALAVEACVTPVLSISEVALHPHHVARQSFMSSQSFTVPAPGPRFSRTPATPPAGYWQGSDERPAPSPAQANLT